MRKFLSETRQTRQLWPTTCDTTAASSLLNYSMPFGFLSKASWTKSLGGENQMRLNEEHEAICRECFFFSASHGRTIFLLSLHSMELLLEAFLFSIK